MGSSGRRQTTTLSSSVRHIRSRDPLPRRHTQNERQNPPLYPRPPPRTWNINAEPTQSPFPSWGFASILQTPYELHGDAPWGSLLPVITAPIIHSNMGQALKANITFEWDLPFPKEYDGLSILVNDVERYRGYEDAGQKSFTWVRHVEGLPEYFRFAYLSGSARGDYTKAGTWGADDGWRQMKDGPS